MPDTIEPTPEVPRPSDAKTADDELTTASLAKTTEDAAAEPTRSFAGGDGAAAANAGGERHEPLFSTEETQRLRGEWNAIQASFVDEPRRSVEQADHLVASAIRRLAEIFAEEKGHLEGQWDRGGDVSTEDLRQALRRYRAFFGRVLSV